MKREAAMQALAPIVATTAGWSDDAVDIYVDMLADLENPAVLAEVCTRIARTWTNPGKPPLGAICTAYNQAVGREYYRTPELAPVHRDLTARRQAFAAGMRIARDAYHAECARQGRAPDPEHFAKWGPDHPDYDEMGQ